MRPAAASNPLVLIVVLALVGWSIYRRTRSQRVRLVQTVAITALIVLSSLLGVVANTRLLAVPLFVELAPVALLAGLWVGWMMMRTIRFWRDQQTGQVWMSGGAVYVAIWFVILIFRLGIEYLATGGFSSVATLRGNQTPTTLSVLASDLLFLSVGLWLARGYVLVRRYRQYATTGTTDQ